MLVLVLVQVYSLWGDLRHLLVLRRLAEIVLAAVEFEGLMVGGVDRAHRRGALGGLGFRAGGRCAGWPRTPFRVPLAVATAAWPPQASTGCRVAAVGAAGCRWLPLAADVFSASLNAGWTRTCTTPPSALLARGGSFVLVLVQV